MSQLICELQKEHTVIYDLLSAAKRNGIATKEGKESLQNVKDTLIAHLKKEDTKLYPVLRKAAETDAVLRQTLDLFAKDIDDLSKYVLQFFDKYSSGGDSAEFAREFGWLYSILQMRIRKEESSLYKAYEKLNP